MSPFDTTFLSDVNAAVCTDYVCVRSFPSVCCCSHVNDFTGTVYQSVLLSQKHPHRAAGTSESVPPNTSPAQWPGKPAYPKHFAVN